MSLGKSMGLEVDDEDVEELVEENRAELSTKKLQELQKKQQQTVAEEISSGEKGEGRKSTVLVKEMRGKWVEVQNSVEKYHPDKALTSQNVDLFNKQCRTLETFFLLF